MSTYTQAMTLAHYQYFERNQDIYIMRRLGKKQDDFFIVTRTMQPAQYMEQGELIEFISQRLKGIDIDLRDCPKRTCGQA